MEPSSGISYKRTRIAPTPSGYLHLGNILSFSLTAALAEKSGASILLRIDDLDQERASPAYVQDIFDTLNFMEIGWHEGPRNRKEFEAEYSQVHRLPLYQQALKELEKRQVVFACDCSRSILQQYNSIEYPGICRPREISLEESNVNWRLATDPDKFITLTEITGARTMNVLPPAMRHYVVRKKDGNPSYQLSSMVDDLHFGVDLIVRGADLYDSTLAQLYLSETLHRPAFQEITFYHHPLITSDAGVKLSKSAGDLSIQYLRKQGYSAATIYGMVAKAAGIREKVTDWRSLATAIGPD